MFTKALTLFSGVFAFMVVALGAWTRLADAGLGCPDWPGCYGFITIPINQEDISLANERFPDSPYELAKAIPEVIHRYFAAFLGLLIIGIYLSIIKKHDFPKHIRTLSGFLVLWVCMQGLFGYLTVSLKLWPQVVTSHLLAGFAATVILWVLFFKIKDFYGQARKKWNLSNPILKLISIGIFLVTFQIFLGAWTSTNYAALSCPDFPTCQGVFWPEADFKKGFNLFQAFGPNFLGGLLDHESRVAIHLVHRYGAIVITLYLSGLAWVLFSNGYLLLSLGLLLALIFQLVLGISNVLFSLPLLVAVGHNLGGLFLINYLSVLRFRE